MIITNETFNQEGDVVQTETIDTTAQTVTYDPPRQGPPDPETGEPGPSISVRPFTTEESTYWSGYQAAIDATTNAQQTSNKLIGKMGDLQTMIETENTTITFVGSTVTQVRNEAERAARDALVRDKELARTLRWLIRQVEKLNDGVD